MDNRDRRTPPPALVRFPRCDWGITVGLPGDTVMCSQTAVETIVLHDPTHRDDDGLALRLCAEHADKIREHTDPTPDHEAWQR